MNNNEKKNNQIKIGKSETNTKTNDDWFDTDANRSTNVLKVDRLANTNQIPVVTKASW